MLHNKLFRKRLPSFIFEVTVVIVGILLSLMISNWAQGRKDGKKEQAFLVQIETDLQDDRNRLQSDMSLRGNQLDFVSSMLRLVNNNHTEVDPAVLLGGMQALISTVTFLPNNVTFRSLENTGQLQLIKDQRIVKSLMDLYTNSYGSLTLNNEDVTTYRNNFLLPYVVEHFDMNGSIYRGDMNGIDKLLYDRNFTNHLLYNQISLSSTLGAYEQSITKVDELLKLVQNRID